MSEQQGNKPAGTGAKKRPPARGSYKNSKAARRKRRRRQLQIIYTCMTLLLVIVTLLIVGLLHATTRRTNQNRAEREAAISAEEAAIQAKRDLIKEAEKLADAYDYDGAVALLTQQENYDTDSELVNAIAKFTASKSALEAKNVLEVPHIFYHSLIVDTDRAFDSSKLSADTIAGNNAWMTTTDEFDKITQQMYDNGWILVKMRDLVTEYTGEDGYVHFKQNRSLLLPADKHPYVLSIDDWSYYHSYDDQGYGSKAVLDENGMVKVQYKDKDGNVSVGDYDVVPRLETFISSHPDASYRGARGLIALTGYNGVFGYRTDVAYKTGERLGQDQAAFLQANPDFDWDKEVAEATKIANAVKRQGWEIACHTWGHLSVTGKSRDTIATDQEKWQNTVANITGKTDTIIFAHGNDIGNWKPYDINNNEIFRYLKDMGYNYYANVDASAKYWVQVNDLSVRMGRINCDGLQMWRAISGAAKINVFEDLFDVESVFSPVRPTPVSATGKS
ncbi:MAG: polysaccharide deacetylase family protein [Lachnospiraceae bacterium]|nr:polysaccharide deacetylase family protein [Lachnospiraceae bacterium]